MKYFAVLTVQAPDSKPQTYAAEIRVKPGALRSTVFEQAFRKLLGRPPAIGRDAVLFWSLEQDQLS